MARRWAEEIRKHSNDAGEDCHCLRGMGFMRKRRPWECPNAGCYICHPDKLHPKPRGQVKRREIEYWLNESSR